MKSNKLIFFWYTIANLVCFLICLITASNGDSLEQSIEQQLTLEQLQHQYPENVASVHDVVQPLKRKRRYLEFPEGSSFQLVYDLIVGVVDFTNYLILGVTVALAWELPSKPPSEIFEDLTERLRDGTLGTSRNDTVENINYIDRKTIATTTKTPVSKSQYNLQPMFRPPMHYQYYTHRVPDSFYNYPSQSETQSLKSYKPNRYKTWSRKSNTHKYYTPKQAHPFTKWTKIKIQPKYSAKGVRYPWWNLPQRLKNSVITRPSVRRFDQNINYSRAQSNYKKPIGTYKTFPRTGRSEHRIYPIFGKQSIPDVRIRNGNLTVTQHRFRRSGIFSKIPSKLDRIHIGQHRRTRHDLYQRIEIYLNGRGSHGHHCVLRALCETGQKSHERKPGSFVGELMRAIFTMPEPIDATADGRPQIGYKEQRYDTANSLKGNCASRYNLCKDSLWSSHLVL